MLIPRFAHLTQAVISIYFIQEGCVCVSVSMFLVCRNNLALYSHHIWGNFLNILRANLNSFEIPVPRYFLLPPPFSPAPLPFSLKRRGGIKREKSFNNDGLRDFLQGLSPLCFLPPAEYQKLFQGGF